MAAALLVLLLLLAVSSTAFTTTDVYYATADDAAGQCPPHQICHNLSYYISQPDYYFTFDTTIIFLEGEHSFDREDLVHVSNVHNLTLKGQGQWPVTGAEETVMQSTVIINCTRGRGGFFFRTSHNITVEGLTVVNCGGLGNAVFIFDAIQSLFFLKISIQHMTGYGLYLYNSDNVIATNCSYYHSALCNISHKFPRKTIGGAVGIVYDTQYSNKGYTLELSHSNMTKCCNYKYGGGILLATASSFGSATVLFSHLILLRNKAKSGGGLAFLLKGTGNITLVTSSCLFSHGSALWNGGGIGLQNSGKGARSNIMIEDTSLVNNMAAYSSEILLHVDANNTGLLSIINSSIEHTTAARSDRGIWIHCLDKCHILFHKTRMTFVNISLYGIYFDSIFNLSMIDSQFERNRDMQTVISMYQTNTFATNCSFTNNSHGRTVITACLGNNVYTSSTIADNNMTGITLVHSGILFIGRNVIQNNRFTKGAGITLLHNGFILLDGDLILTNNTAMQHGGAILSSVSLLIDNFYIIVPPCSLCVVSNTSTVIFSGNRASTGGSDVYNTPLVNCYCPKSEWSDQLYTITHIGQPNETSWYFDTPLMKFFRFSNTDRMSSMSTDPIMVCFCNESNLPDCSDRSQRHVQIYPGLEFSTSIATVGYYGGTSPGEVVVTAQHATLVRYYRNSDIRCFKLHILVQTPSSATAMVDIGVAGGIQDWGVSYGVDIMECPVGFTHDKISGQCRCEQFLTNGNNVKCNVSATSPFKFQRSGNSWFAYINNTQCITGTTNCPFDYCNRSNVSFDIMAPDCQCVANRTGILCGQCQSHLSIMLGSNHCGTCSNWYLFLLPVFALAGIVLVAVLMFLNLSVSVGTINGLLFYANMVKLNEAFFFPNGSVPVVSQFISWLNLDLGIEVCLFDGLDGYWNTWLQFVFPAHGWYYCGLSLLCVALQVVWLSCCPSTSYTVSHVLH